MWYWGNTFSTFLMFYLRRQKPFTDTPGISLLSFHSLSPRCREQPPGSAPFYTFQRGTPPQVRNLQFSMDNYDGVVSHLIFLIKGVSWRPAG